MADKPSRALVIFGDGCASLVSPSHSNLHSFASRASCGFLSLRDPHAPEAENDRVIRELAQLLDAYDLYILMNERNDESDVASRKELSLQKVSERFMGLRAAMFTKCPSVRSYASNLGFSVFELDELSESDEPSDELLQLLGFSGGDVLDKCEFDLVFVHVLISEKPKNPKEKLAISTGADWLNELVGGIMQTALPGSCIASRLHFSVVLSYDTVSEGTEEFSLTLNSSKETDSDLYLLRPRQSYTMRGGKILNDIRHHHPVLIAQWQEGVTRKDLAKTFSFNEFKEVACVRRICVGCCGHGFRDLHHASVPVWGESRYTSRPVPSRGRI